MSYTTLTQQNLDSDLLGRLDAAVRKEAWANPSLAETDFGEAIRQGSVWPQAVFMWPLCVSTEAAYEYAIESGNPAPGKDPAVISDSDILASVQANWPPTWPLEPVGAS
jgi:hypothetical protein